MRIRLYLLAKELGVSSKDLVDKVRARGIQVKSHMSSIQDPVANALRAEYAARAARVAAPPRPAPPAPRPAPPAPRPAPPAARPAPPPARRVPPAPRPPRPPAPGAAPGAAPEVIDREAKGVSRRRRTVVRRPEAGAAEPKGERAASPGVVREYGPHVRIKERRPTREGEGGILRSRRRPRRDRRGTRVRREIEPRVPTTPSKVVTDYPVTIRSLSQSAGVKTDALIRALVKNGIMATMNEALGDDVVALLSKEIGIEIRVRRGRDFEGELVEAQAKPDLPEDLQLRAPVVAFLGHVDHGKTSLLDAIRQSHVVDTESGGITQHIGAYTVRKADRTVVFLDTPGHQAFTAMRARGAQITDIVVLVVAADDGVMPQTEEAINHAKAAGVPIVVAINKMDLPGANPTRVSQQLANLGLLPAKWGGETEVVEVSAITKQGLDDLIETLAIQAEVLELKANRGKSASGTVIEAKLSEGRGAVATVLVRDGTLRRGDVVLCGRAYGRVRSLHDDRGRPIEEAGPASPVGVAGLSTVPEAGDSLAVLDDIETARAMAEARAHRAREASIAERAHVTLDNLFATLAEGKANEINVILKADVQGSLEVIRKALDDLATNEVRVNVIHAAVGGINDSDVLLADASDAIVIGFHVVPEPSARALAEQDRIDIRLYNVIYHLTDDIKAALEDRLEPERRENVLAHCEVRQIFRISRFGSIAGCYVTDGRVTRNVRARLIRDSIVIYDGKLASLRRFKDDVREVVAGMECGIKIEGYNDVKVGDTIEIFEVQEIRRTL